MNQRIKILFGFCAVWLIATGFALNDSTFADKTTATQKGESSTEFTVELTLDQPKKKGSPISRLFGLFSSSGDEEKSAEPEGQDQSLQATHHQTALLKITPEDADEQKPAQESADNGWGVKSFCLDSHENLLVAVGDAEQGQLQILNPQGERQQSLPLPVVPEAINVDPEGNYLVAGAGKLFKLDSQGNVLLEASSPLIAQLQEGKAELRQQVIDQIKARSQRMVQQRDVYQQQLDRLFTNAATRLERGDREEFLFLQKRLAEFSEADASKLSAEEQNAWALRKVLFRMLETKVEENLVEQEIQMRDIFRQQLQRADKMAKSQDGSEPSDEQIETALASTIRYKSRIASISAADNQVFIATGSTQGYGYDVWRFDGNLENPELIVSKLRGCCGQMDVQACSAGLFVAENSRHQVQHFDLDGERVNSWGSRNREGLQGFGGCCNPMNVAFGPDGSVYTAESTTGRIKHYSAEGELIELVGSVELVPGCKKVSIAVTQDHQRVYMLDITRNHIIVMEAKSDEQKVASKEEVESAS